MKFYLMHKDIIVAQLDIGRSGNLSKIYLNEQNKGHIPVCGMQGIQKLYEWWADRAVPTSRHGVMNVLRQLGMLSTSNMLVDNLALSLDDCYWIKPNNRGSLSWKDVSLFRNHFEDVFGELTFNTHSRFDLRDKTLFWSVSSQGELQKKWGVDADGRRFLVKGNHGDTCQQSLNEVFACEIHKRQQAFPFVQYSLTPVTLDGGGQGVGCCSYNFCSETVELVSAWEILKSGKRYKGDSIYNTFKRDCMQLCGFTEEYVDSFLGYQILTDYLITNTDRHMNNIAVLRNPDTLQYYGFAPIYDSGNSMFFRGGQVPKGNCYKVPVCSFVRWEQDLLRLVRNRMLVDLDRLPTQDVFYQVYAPHLPAERVEVLWNAFQRKVYLLRRFQSGVDVWKPQELW